MSWFCKRRSKRSEGLGDRRLTEGFSRKVLAGQRKIADSLYRRTQHWNRSSKIIALLLFCLLFGGCCLLLVFRAFIHH